METATPDHAQLQSDGFLDRYLAEAGDRRHARSSAPTRSRGRGIQLFERIEGDNFTIIGLPLLPLLAELQGARSDRRMTGQEHARASSAGRSRIRARR